MAELGERSDFKFKQYSAYKISNHIMQSRQGKQLPEKSSITFGTWMF